MGFFNWARKGSIPEAIYSVMNDDHVELYRIVSELSDIVGQRCTSPHERDVQRLHLLGVVQKLIDKATEHFRREEHLMEAYRYPEAKVHRSEHLMLQRTIETTLSRLSAEHHPITEDVPKNLKSWLTNHIRTADRQLDRFLIAASKKMGSADNLKLAQGMPAWTPEHSMYWASFNDAVSIQTVSENRKKNADAIQEMEERQRRERERRAKASRGNSGAEQARQMRAVFFE
jgi:hemerythrin-like metal-binding protein